MDSTKFRSLTAAVSGVINPAPATPEVVTEGAEKDTKGDKEAYQKFFKKTLKKYGADSPEDLSDEDKKKFYDEIDAGWKADDEKPEKNESKVGKLTKDKKKKKNLAFDDEEDEPRVKKALRGESVEELEEGKKPKLTDKQIINHPDAYEFMKVSHDGVKKIVDDLKSGDYDDDLYIAVKKISSKLSAIYMLDVNDINESVELEEGVKVGTLNGLGKKDAKLLNEITDKFDVLVKTIVGKHHQGSKHAWLKEVTEFLFDKLNPVATDWKRLVKKIESDPNKSRNNQNESVEMEEAAKISGKDAYKWLTSNKVFDDEDFTNPPSFEDSVKAYRGSGPALDAFINLAKKHGGKKSTDGWGWIGGARNFYDKVLVPAAKGYVSVEESVELEEAKSEKYKEKISGDYGKNRVTAGYEIERGEGVKVVSLGRFDSVEDALLALKKIPGNWTDKYYTLGNEKFGERKLSESTEELEEGVKKGDILDIKSAVGGTMKVKVHKVDDENVQYTKVNDKGQPMGGRRQLRKRMFHKLISEGVTFEDLNFMSESTELEEAAKMTTKQAAEAIAAHYNRAGYKARVWHKGSFSRVYIDKKGRFIEIDSNGNADVSNMMIHQAREGAAAICASLGITVTAK